MFEFLDDIRTSMLKRMRYNTVDSKDLTEEELEIINEHCYETWDEFREDKIFRKVYNPAYIKVEISISSNFELMSKLREYLKDRGIP